MSLYATNYVLHRRFGNHIRKLIMIAIADFAGDAGEAWPSIDTIAARAECSRRSVQEHLAILEDAGELRVIPNAGRRGTNLYRIIFKKSAPQESPPEGVQDLHGGVQMSAQGGADERRPFAPEPSGTVNEPLRRNSPLPPQGESERADAALIEDIKSLRRAWQATPLLSAREHRQFIRNRAMLQLFSTSDWQTLREFLAARIPDSSAYFQPRLLSKFLESPGEVLGHAVEWRSKLRKPTAAPPPPPPEQAPLSPQEISAILHPTCK